MIVREMTIFFADIRKFSTISEKLSERTLLEFADAILKEMRNIVFRGGGIINVYTGDGLMAYWDSKIFPEHKRMAVSAGEILTKKDWSAYERAWGIESIRVGVGIHTGTVCKGKVVGIENVYGDAVNVAARIEALTKVYQQKILVSENAIDDSAYIFLKIAENVLLKGREKPITIYRPVGFK